jgi:hypothetical protein
MIRCSRQRNDPVICLLKETIVIEKNHRIALHDTAWKNLMTTTTITMQKRWRFLLIVLFSLMVLGEWQAQARDSAETRRERESAKRWLRNAKYGVMVHFLGGGPGWNDTVNRFDVDAFSQQMADVGAGYVIFTLGQNSGYYCAPNATYERYGGFSTGERCSVRDLPLDLAEKLERHGIRLILYSTARAPRDDMQARKGLAEIEDLIRSPAPQEFTRRWSEVIREWSERYGTKVAGWWFDGAYTTDGWDDDAQPYNWHTWAEAARTGHPERLLAFNKGTAVEHAFGVLTDEQDFTAGERNGFDLTPKDAPAPDNLQWHLLAYMGEDWRQKNGPTKSDAWMIDYIRSINEQGGVVSIDVHVDQGRVYEPHYKQLLAIGNALRGQDRSVPNKSGEE